MSEGCHAIGREIIVRLFCASGSGDAQRVDLIRFAETKVQEELVLGEVR